MTIAEVLMAIAISTLVLFASFQAFNHLSKASKTSELSLSRTSLLSDVRIAIDQRSQCQNAFRSGNQAAYFDPSNTTAVTDFNQLWYKDSAVVIKNTERPDGLKVVGLDLEAIGPGIVEGSKLRYPVLLKIKIEKVNSSNSYAGNSFQEKVYKLSIVTDASTNKILNCGLNLAQMETAAARRSAIAIKDAGCEAVTVGTGSNQIHPHNIAGAVTPGIFAFPAAGVAAIPASTCAIADSDGDGLCDTSPNYPLRKHPYSADPTVAADAGDLHIKYYLWKRFFPKRNAGLRNNQIPSATVAGVNYAPPLDEHASSSGVLAAPLHPPKNANEGRCWVDIKQAAANVSDQNDVFYIPSGSSLAIGCKASEGWFVSGCWRSDNGSGYSSIEVVESAGNDICKTNDHLKPSAQKAWSVKNVTMGVICMRVKQ